MSGSQMAGTDDKFNPPKLTLPPDFLRQLNLPPDIAQRLGALVSPEVKQRLSTLVSPEARQQLERFTQWLQQQHPLLKPQIGETIRSVRQKRKDKAAIEKELCQLELSLDSEIPRELWDPTTSPSPSASPPSSPPTAPAPVQPQLSPEEPKKWRRGQELDWLVWAMETNPQKPKESKNEWADRLYGKMQKDFETDLRWGGSTLRRRMGDPALKGQAK
jgi:hypothetical protein